MANQPGGGRKSIRLALQGGGAHGAFTWGVLDKLLEDGRVHIDAISGTSAGAMNGVVAADGLVAGGEDGARAALEKFWRAVSGAARMSPLQRTPWDAATGNWSLDASPGFVFFDLVNRLSSPYDLNPLNINPLRDIVDDLVDFDRVRRCTDMDLFVSATNVHTGRVRVFTRERMTLDMVMASACLPHVFQAVEIDGVPYWDGGYMGNPSLFPLYDEGHGCDIAIVQINPIERAETPKSAREILNRVNEITFNASLLKELRAIEFVQRLLAEGKLEGASYRHINVHIIESTKDILPLGASSKMNGEWAFLRHLFDIGREAADEWLDTCFEYVGERSSVDLRQVFQGIGPEAIG